MVNLTFSSAFFCLVLFLKCLTRRAANQFAEKYAFHADFNAKEKSMECARWCETENEKMITGKRWPEPQWKQEQQQQQQIWS